jgi:AraC-like DNA-binding protein
MALKKIHLIRASQATPFIETAKRLGLPVGRLARAADLPVEAVLAGEGVIGERCLWHFIELAIQYKDCEHLGYLTALDHSVTHTGQLGGMEISLTGSLRDILRIFCRDVVTQSDGSLYRLVRRKGQTWFTRDPMFSDSPAGWQAEQYVLTFVIQIVRLCAPGDWLPGQIRIATQPMPASVPAEWSSIDVDWGCEKTEILIDDAVLKLAPRIRADANLYVAHADGSIDSVMLIEDLIDRQIWTRQCGLDHAAAELGMSNATLKRRLAEMNTNYSMILRERRIHHAKRLLTESNMSVADIAKALGYSAVSNFSRAFRNATGQAPNSIRYAH